MTDRRTWLAVVGLALLFAVPVVAFAQETDNGDSPAANGETATAPAEEEAPVAVQTRGWLSRAIDGFINYWKLGGPLMWGLLVLAVVAVAYLLVCLFTMTRGAVAPHGLAARAHQFYKQGKFAEAKQIAQRSRSSLGKIIVYLIEHRNNDIGNLTMGAGDVAGRDFDAFNRRRYPLIAVGTMAPLVGLTGTILGLMGAFATIGVVGSMDEPSALAGDIGEAMVTTIGGLFIAVPALALFHFFRNRASSLASILDEEVSNLMNAWFLKKEVDSARPQA